jgi:glutamate carboxypeptidase
VTPVAPQSPVVEPSLPKLIEDVRTLVGCESPSVDLAAVRRSADLVSALGTERLGVAPERIDVDGCSHVCWRFGAGPRRVLLLAHHDTVWPVGTLARLPWSQTDDVIRGPGTVDMKAGLVVGFHALAGLAEAGVGLDGVTYLVTGDEEIGSPSSRQLIEREALGCAAALVLEGAGSLGALKTGRKGISRYLVRITGRAAHAGGEPEKGVNAGVELAQLILAVAALNRPDIGTTVTPTAAWAGTTSNTVPAQAELHIDVRARSVAEQQRVHRALLALRPTLPGSSWTFQGAPNRPPMEPATSAALFARAVQVAEYLGLGPLRPAFVGGASDGNFTAGIGVPTLDGLGPVGGGAHADDEHVLVASLAPRTTLLAALVADALASSVTAVRVPGC